MKLDAKKDAAVFLLMGQSNAAGHWLPMAEEDKILTPMKNVFGLTRELNQTFDNTELFWSGWISGGTNLAEIYDHSWSAANCLAKLWQAEIDAGADLPDLYIVHLAMGAHGVTEKYCWYPYMEKTMEPGGPWQSKISLYLFGVHLLSLLKPGFEKIGKNMRILGLHWQGGENDCGLPIPELKEILPGLYRMIFGGFREAVGEDFPVILHTMINAGHPEEGSREWQGQRGTDCINEIFAGLAREEKNMAVFDRLRAPHYDPADELLNLFLPDKTHYTYETNRWTAEEILKDAKGEGSVFSEKK